MFLACRKSERFSSTLYTIAQAELYILYILPMMLHLEYNDRLHPRICFMSFIIDFKILNFEYDLLMFFWIIWFSRYCDLYPVVIYWTIRILIHLIYRYTCILVWFWCLFFRVMFFHCPLISRWFIEIIEYKMELDVGKVVFSLVNCFLLFLIK